MKQRLQIRARQMPLREASDDASVKQSRQCPPGIDFLIEAVLAGEMAGLSDVGALAGREFDGDVSIFKVEQWLHRDPLSI